MSDIGAVAVKRDIFMEVKDTKSDSKFIAISKSHRTRQMSLSDLREICDLCMEPRDKEYAGAAVTLRGASKRVDVRDVAESALKFYNDTKSKNFKLVKVYKMNIVASTYFGLTFRAQEDGSEESPLFRGVVYGRKKPLFCEIKDDDEVTLLPLDDDHVSPERACENEDIIPPSICDIGAVDVKHDLFMELSDTESDDDSKFIAISNSHRIRRMSLSELREICDFCKEPRDKEYAGAAVTLRGASKRVDLRDLAESALKFYNDTTVRQLKNFKLVKVYKINIVASTYFGLTFRAQEDGSEEVRGIVYLVGRAKPLFCEIKVLFMTGAITTPLDVIKTRLMVQGSTNQYKGIVDCVQTIVREEGAPALLKGIGPRVLLIGIGGSIFFGVLESTKRLLAERHPKNQRHSEFKAELKDIGLNWNS